MKTSNKGIDLIRQHEQLRLSAYLDPCGIPTIGWGHTKGVKLGQTITEDQAIRFLQEDLQTAEKAVNAQCPDINQNQFDALVSFVFNVGIGNFQKSTLLRKIKANPGDPEISYEFSRWKFGTVKGIKTVLGGLVRRRKDEADLYFAK